MKRLAVEIEQEIIKLYVDEKKSTPTIASLMGVSSTCVTNIIKRNNLPRRNISEARAGTHTSFYPKPEPIIELYVNQKKSQKTIATILNISPNTIRAILKEHGINRRGPGYQEDYANPNTEKILELYSKGLSINQVAKELDMSYGGVNKILAKHSVIRTELKAAGLSGEKNGMYGKKWEKEYRDKVYEGRTGLNYEQYLAQLPEYEAYKKQVMSFTNKQALDTLPNFDKRGPSGQPGAYHLDHRFSIMEGFRQGIDPEIIGGIKNLEMLTYEENIAKLDGCSIDINNIC